jgi:hypothetical protein
MRHLLIASVFIVALAGRAAAQESKAAATTRKNLQQKVTLAVKEIGLKNFLESELNGELEKPLRFKIDNASGVSNNMKVSFTGKSVTVEKTLNELADKYDFGYYVISNAGNNTVDGKIMIRKSSKGKERGYEAGKEPKKGAMLDTGEPSPVRGRLMHGCINRPLTGLGSPILPLVAGVSCCYRPIGRIMTG